MINIPEIYSEELYLNYLHQFGKKEARKYGERSIKLKNFVRIMFNHTIAMQSFRIAMEELNKIFIKKK